MKKKVIIFDFDGVIIDSWEHAYLGNVRNWPDLIPAEHRNFFNGNIHEAISKLPEGKYSSEENNKWWEEEHSLTKNNLPMYVEIQEVIKELSKEYILTINTSSDAKSTQDYLEKNEIDVFKTIYGTEISRSKVQKFRQMFSDLGVQAEDCVFITDTVGDVLDANSVSVSTIVVTYGYQQAEHFESIKDKVIGLAGKPTDILEILKSVN